MVRPKLTARERRHLESLVEGREMTRISAEPDARPRRSTVRGRSVLRSRRRPSSRRRRRQQVCPAAEDHRNPIRLEPLQARRHAKHAADRAMAGGESGVANSAPKGKRPEDRQTPLPLGSGVCGGCVARNTWAVCEGEPTSLGGVNDQKKKQQREACRQRNDDSRIGGRIASQNVGRRPAGRANHS